MRLGGSLALPGASSLCAFMRRLFHDFDFALGQVVEFVDEAVDLLIRGVDLALKERLVVVCPGLRQLPVQGLRYLNALCGRGQGERSAGRYSGDPRAPGKPYRADAAIRCG